MSEILLNEQEITEKKVSIKRLLSQVEFQVRTGVSRARQWQLREKGELGFYHIGGRIKYGEHHVEEFLRSCEKSTLNK